jgi:DNA-binding LytR/AlgR family response regulator
MTPPIQHTAGEPSDEARPTTTAPYSGPTALIAEDEPLLAQALVAELARAWPELQIVARVGDGDSAVREALRLRPDVMFLDIRMPGRSGLEAARAVAEDWVDSDPETGGGLPPALVFVTAYDKHAVAAFEAQAVDYLLKPVDPQRLQKTVVRVQATLKARTATSSSEPAESDSTMERLRALLDQHDRSDGFAPSTANAPPPAVLRLLPAALPGTGGATVRMVPVDDVLAFEAADKYVRVLTASAEHLIRLPLRDLQPQLDATVFWQIHRGTIVRAEAIDTVSRDEAGHLHLSLRGIDKETFTVSRLYAQRFRAL